MNIGILIANMLPYGAEIAAVRLADSLQRCGADVHIFALDGRSDMSLQVPVHCMISGNGLKVWQEFAYAPLQLIRLKRLIRETNREVVISFMERSNIFNLCLPRSVRKILTVHTYLSSGFRVNGWFRRIPTKLLYGRLLNRADAISFVSRAAALDFQTLFSPRGPKIEVIHNPLDIDQVRIQAAEPLEPDLERVFERNIIVHMGRFTLDKGQWYLIRILPEIRKRVPDAELVFLGEGEGRAYLEGLVHDLGLTACVHFLGFQENPFKYISRARVLACSSTREGFPNALVEALACGVVVISADCKSGPRELLAPGTDVRVSAQEKELADYGVLVPPLDGLYKRADEPLIRAEVIMAEAIVEVLTDGNLREEYRRKGYQRAEEFRPACIAEKWQTVLSDLSHKAG